jgi:predicted XRE-type DNA-binding protein
MKKNHVTTGSVFDDLGFSKEEAQNLKIRAALMRALDQYIEENELTQEKAAQIFGVAQPRVSDLVCGKIDKFTIDMLVNMLIKAGINVALVIDDRLAA